MKTKTLIILACLAVSDAASASEVTLHVTYPDTTLGHQAKDAAKWCTRDGKVKFVETVVAEEFTATVTIDGHTVASAKGTQSICTFAKYAAERSTK